MKKIMLTLSLLILCAMAMYSQDLIEYNEFNYKIENFKKQIIESSSGTILKRTESKSIFAFMLPDIYSFDLFKMDVEISVLKNENISMRHPWECQHGCILRYAVYLFIEEEKNYTIQITHIDKEDDTPKVVFFTVFEYPSFESILIQETVNLTNDTIK